MAYALAFLLSRLARAGGGIPPTLTPGFVVLQELGLLIIFLVPAVIMAGIERRTLADYGLPLRLRPAWRSNFWIGTAWGVISLTFLLLVLRINRAFLFGTITIDAKDAVRYALTWVLAFLLVGITEEFTFRGYVLFTLTSGLRFLRSYWGFAIAAIVTSLLFGLAHTGTGNTGETLVGIGTVVAIGLFFAFTLWRTGSLWFAIGFHASWDWAQTFLYGVPNSGVVAKGHLLNPTIQGSSWYSGGTVGPEGSMLMYPLIVVMVLIFYRTMPKSTYPAADVSEALPRQDF